MATQIQTHKGVEHDQPRHRRRAKERPDAFENQFSKPSETDFPTEQDNTESNRTVSDAEPHTTLREVAKVYARMDKAMYGYLAEACKKFDHEKFDLQTLADSHGYPTVSNWLENLEFRVRKMNGVCIHGYNNPEPYLSDPYSTNTSYWAEVEAIFGQSTDETRSATKPPEPNENLIIHLGARCNRHSVLIADLLPELVELKQFNLQMQSVLRRKWAIIDGILDCFYGNERKNRCEVPRWRELSEIFKHSATNAEDQLPARLNHISSTLWLSLLVFVLTIPTTALGWRFSPHQRGTTQDADFWFLIQSSCMMTLSFAVLAIPIWRTKTFSVKARFWVWGLLIAAALCVALSPLVYVFGPTEWSQFMSIVSGIVQVFLTLQIALVADSAGQRGGQSGKKDK